MSDVSEIDEEIIKCKHIRLELSSDIDEILDIINDINKTISSGNIKKTLYKSLNSTLKQYLFLLEQYSKLINGNDDLIRKFEDIKSQMLLNGDQKCF